MSASSRIGSLSFKWVTISFYLIFILLPFIPVFYLSFHSTLRGSGVPVGDFTFLNYAHIFSNPKLVDAIVSSISYVLLNLLITLPVAIPAAYAFSRYKFIGTKHLFLGLLALRMTPPVVLIFPVYQLFSALDLVNSPLSIALAHCLFNVPISIWVLESFITAIPKEFDETAFIDGYSLPRFFIRKLIPILAPGIGVTAFFCFMFSWVEVVFARILTVTNGKPMSMAISSLFSFKTDIGLVMAMTVCSLIPGAIMIFFVRNHISKGFMVSGVK